MNLRHTKNGAIFWATLYSWAYSDCWPLRATASVDRWMANDPLNHRIAAVTTTVTPAWQHQSNLCLIYFWAKTRSKRWTCFLVLADVTHPPMSSPAISAAPLLTWNQLGRQSVWKSGLSYYEIRVSKILEIDVCASALLNTFLCICERSFHAPDTGVLTVQRSDPMKLSLLLLVTSCRLTKNLEVSLRVILTSNIPVEHYGISAANVSTDSVKCCVWSAFEVWTVCSLILICSLF